MVQFRCCAIMMLLFVISHKDNSDADEPIIIESSSASVEADWARFVALVDAVYRSPKDHCPTLESLEKETGLEGQGTGWALIADSGRGMCLFNVVLRRTPECALHQFARW